MSKVKIYLIFCSYSDVKGQNIFNFLLLLWYQKLKYMYTKKSYLLKIFLRNNKHILLQGWFLENHIGGVMVSMLDSSQTKDYRIGICCLSNKQAALRRKSKDWLAWYQENVSWVRRHVYLQIVASVN